MNRFLKAVCTLAMGLWVLLILACILVGVWLMKLGHRVPAIVLFLFAGLQAVRMLGIFKK